MMECIRFAVDTIAGNIDEARRYIRLAMEYRETQKPLADWCRDMASMHINFNAAGMANARRLIDDMRAASDHPEYAEGAAAVWMDRLMSLTSANAEAKAIVDSYK